MLAFLLLGTAQPMPSETTPSVEANCSYDLDAMLALDRQAFDQDMAGGWRPLAQKKGCEIATAELIREWRHQKRDHEGILYWHEGQMRAFGGETKQAIALFELTYNPPEFDHEFGWNYYVTGTIAFLVRDRDRLEQAIEGLSGIPEPSNNTFTRPDGTVIQLSWPPNLDVLKAFDRCWERSYSEAYGTEECRSPELPTK